MSPDDSRANFDPNGPGIAGNLFGLPFSGSDTRILILPVPWEVTVSYQTGTAAAPEAILNASRQVDLFHREIPDAWKLGVEMAPIPEPIRSESKRLRQLVDQVHAMTSPTIDQRDVLSAKINEACETLNIYVRTTAQAYLNAGKIVGLLGGDHSSPLGFLRALSEKHEKFGILQFDAHADLRKSYEGFAGSHASIMFNALKHPAISRLVQVGIRDLCEEENMVIEKSMGRVKTFFDDDIKKKLSAGKSWDSLCTEIVKELPQKVYISFDIDSLDPKLCPSTGTPVAGGLEFHQAVDLIKAVATSGRSIIGFDLCEVGSTDWDANVGARILWQLCNWTGVSNGYLSTRER